MHNFTVPLSTDSCSVFMRKSIAPFALLLFCATSVQFGCNPNRGCTDPYSDNFDPDAAEDDDTCVPTRMKFVGDYQANGTTYGMVSVADTFLTSYEQIALSITDETAAQPDQLIIGLSNFDQPIYALTTLVVSQYKLNIISQTIGAFTYYGEANINGRVFEMDYTRVEKIEVAPDEFVFDTLYINLYGIQEIK